MVCCRPESETGVDQIVLVVAVHEVAVKDTYRVSDPMLLLLCERGERRTIPQEEVLHPPNGDACPHLEPAPPPALVSLLVAQTLRLVVRSFGGDYDKIVRHGSIQSERANRERLQRLVALGDGHVAADARWKQPRLNQYFMGDATREERRTGGRVAAASLQPNVDGLDGQVEVGLQ